MFREEVLSACKRQVFILNNPSACANPLDTTDCCGVRGQRDCLAEYLHVDIVAILNRYDVVDYGYRANELTLNIGGGFHPGFGIVCRKYATILVELCRGRLCATG